MEVKVLFFGELAAIADAKKIVVQNMKDTVLMNEYIHEQYPSLKNKTYRIAVNYQLVNGKRDLTDGDEIALLPSFAGG